MPGAGKPSGQGTFDAGLYQRGIADAFRKLDPRQMARNPVMFVVELGSALTTLLWLQALTGHGEAPAGFIGAIAAWLWFTVLFANFAEALAEGRGKAQAESLKKMRQDTVAKKLATGFTIIKGREPAAASFSEVSSSSLRKGDLFYVKAGDTIPADGEVVEGVASVNESAITGESAPVIRESGGDRSAVTGGTVILSDWLIIRASANAGEGFLDHMIGLVEGAKRQKTPNEIALNILLIGLTMVFLVVCATLWAFSVYSVGAAGSGVPVTITVLVALLVCLAPTTIGGLLSAIGIAGMDRLIRRNVITTSGRAIEAAGDVDVLLLDKTGTITLGNRQAVDFIPVDGTTIDELAETAQLASLADETPEGRSIVVLAKEKYGLRGRTVGSTGSGPAMQFVPFTSQTRMSGVDYDTTQIRKGAADVMYTYITAVGNTASDDLKREVDTISRAGGTPLVVARNGRALGVIHLKDIVKGGMKERFSQLRRMGIKTIMITGDNRLTAATIAAEAGVDDFLAEATPESKLALIREYQTGGRMVAMTGDGTNDAPALAQADVAVAMNTGTQPAREAANMIDLDSNPTKLIEIVEIGKQLLMTRGALTTFSIANDLAKYFVIIPAAFVSTYPALAAINILGLHNAILSAVIFNALIIVFLIPIALHGVAYRPMSAEDALRNNILLYGAGGVIAPFIGIKIIDILLVLLGVG
ncbi:MULTISPECIES: potassium-transporting ATPase subunit KdpB [unclassified Methanoregula]|uniref:potassium-transporting ATPase subunit KdpB n=1 Tax=unclassified Methanoregula TaxID=2649730 RepID=UPI0009C7A595|nr:MULTISPECIES: potassium-transporting ATPase subunit KdpB [unclassified Methanoregula]OPX63192.1 MAG: putative copper-exporting P-type ATPase A [Methanoregula sp. PtaB.Bin085]OPY33492.1 MAG: putative copper-exporting P-type ATPase A [Methanoregula sp. PtaU1.Bin006]